MASKREGQTAVLIWMKDDFLAEIDAHLASLGYSDRSKFIRDAVYEKLGLPHTGSLKELAMAPSRQGKGGAPSHRYKKTRGRKRKEKL